MKKYKLTILSEFLKEEVSAKENVVSRYKATTSDPIFTYDKNNLCDNAIDHFSSL